MLSKLIQLTGIITCFSYGGFLSGLGAWAQPCPAETPMFGGTVLDGSSDEYETYWYVADDD